jgi:hypothetical protein
VKKFKGWFKRQRITILFRLRSSINEWIEKYDTCHVCGDKADYWCVSCDQRHCCEHESGLYSDETMCTDCYAILTPEDLAAMAEECATEE